MRRRGFLNGLLTGGLMGVVLGMLFTPRMRSRTRERIMEGGFAIGKRARRLWRRGKEESDEMRERVRH